MRSEKDRSRSASQLAAVSKSTTAIYDPAFAPLSGMASWGCELAGTH